MLERLFLYRMRLLMFLGSLGLFGLAAHPAMAALQKFDMNIQLASQYLAESPKASTLEPPIISAAVLIDESGPSPLLRKYKYNVDKITVTLIFPGLSGGFLFVSQVSSTGMSANQTGSGSTASSINWGNTTGWTTSGGSFCHAIPSYICSLADRVELATVQAPNESTNFDYGTWVFHGTGFTQPGGYVQRTSNITQGNRQNFDRGFRVADGTVPAVPLLAISAVGASLIAISAATARRRRK